MTKNRLQQVLGILLLPYTKQEFNKSGGDPIEESRYCFSELLGRDANSYQDLCKKYYNSEKKLRRFLQGCNEWMPDTLDDFEMILSLYFPEKEISQMYIYHKEKYGRCDKHLIERYYLSNIYKIAESLLTFRDGKIAIRTWVNPKKNEKRDIFDYPNVFDKVELWNQLGRMIVPDIIIAAFFDLTNMNQPEHLHGQNGDIWLSDKVLEKVLRNGIAETHLHMNAGIEYEAYWSELMDLTRWADACYDEKKYQDIVKIDRREYFSLAVFRLAAAEFLESGMGSRHDFSKYCYDWEYNEIIKCLYDGKEMSYNYSLRNIYKMHLIRGYGLNELEQKNLDFLFRTVYKNKRKINTYPEMLFLQQCLNYLNADGVNDGCFLHLFFQYIRLKNYFFQSIIQGDRIQGLANFRQYYGEMSRKGSIYMGEKKLSALFKSVSNSQYLQKLELRIAPVDDIIPREERYEKYTSVQKDLKNAILTGKNGNGGIREILVKYKEYIEQNIKEADLEGDSDLHTGQGDISFPTIGIILHFLKRDYVDNRIADSCWLNEANYTNNILVQQEQMVVCARAVEELRSSIPLLSKYIVGIDAASEENKAEPWIFAPVFVAARNRKATKPFLQKRCFQYEEIQNIGFTYHVGEEFRHILSGLRHVDEVISFFNYHAGDRLGHAIALGTDIAKWVAKNEVVVMPIMEYIEDLLWLWGIIVHNEISYDFSLDVIESRILDLAKEVYGEAIGITTDMMYDAYVDKFKRHDSDFFEKMQKLTTSEADGDNHHFCKYYNKNHPYGFVWTKDKLLCTQFCPLFYQRFQKPIMVYVNKTLVELLKAVQMYVVKKVERLGIYVEVNPTSNLAIGDAEGLHDSHIFRLNSKDLPESEEHEVLVTVNSDDPTIFNTTSENELAYVYYAMLNKGYGRESVLAWIDKVRQHGMDSSFIKEVKTPRQQLSEITEMIQLIDKFLSLQTNLELSDICRV